MTFEKLDDVMKFIDNKSRATVKLYAQKGYINAQKVNALGEPDPKGRFWNIDNADPTIKKWVAETEQMRKEEAAKPHAPSLLDKAQEQIETLKKRIEELEAKNRELQSIIDKLSSVNPNTTKARKSRQMKKRATPEEDAKMLTDWRAFQQEHEGAKKIDFARAIGKKPTTVNEAIKRQLRREEDNE